MTMFNQTALPHSSLPPVRSLVVLLGALVCVLVGAVQLMAFEVPEFLWMSVGTLAMVGVLGVFRLMTTPTFATSWSMLAVSLALGYGVGTLNTMASGYSGGMDLLSVTFASPAVLGRTVGCLLLLVSALLFFGEFDSNKMVPVQQLDEADQRMLMLILVATAAGALLAVATGSLGFQGDMSAEEGSGRVTTLGALISTAMSPMVACALYAFGGQKGRRRWLVYGLCMVLMVILMTQGRRIFLYTALVAAVGFFAVRGVRQFFTIKSLLILMTLAFSVALASKFFFAIRLATHELDKRASLTQLVSQGFTNMLEGDRIGLDERLEENQSTRTFILGYMGELVTGVETHRTVGGGLLELGLATAVPTVVWPGKWAVMAQGSEENICHPTVGLPTWDAANTVTTSGMCDFGWWGFFIYPVVIAALFSLMLALTKRLDIVARLVVAFGMMFGLMNVEIVLAGYFSIMRNLLVLGAGVSLATWLVRWYEREYPSHRSTPHVHR